MQRGFQHVWPLDTMVAKNVPFNCVQMREYACNWNFDIVTRCTSNAQSNCLAEKAVRMAKELIRKTESAGKDFRMTLLELGKMPV